VISLSVPPILGAVQLCWPEVWSRIEGAVYAMTVLFDANCNSVDGWGVLLANASNSFNSFNHTVMLLHAHNFWPCQFCFLFNTYCDWSVLVLQGFFDFLCSKEGVTQGDPCQCL